MTDESVSFKPKKGEPTFVLCASDPQAPTTLDFWVKRKRRRVERKTLPRSVNVEIGRVAKLAREMREWREKNNGNGKTE